MIPPILHRVWLDDPLPETFQIFGDQWEILTNLKRRDWRSVEELPLDMFRHPELVEDAETIFPRDWKRFQADVVRLELLHLYGGLYLDTDVEPGPLAGRLESVFLSQAGEAAWAARSPQHNQGHHPITNCVMAASPEHPWIRCLIDELPDALEQYGERSLAQAIGPWHLTRTYEAGDWPTVTIFEWPQLERVLTHHWNTALRKQGEELG